MAVGSEKYLLPGLVWDKSSLAHFQIQTLVRSTLLGDGKKIRFADLFGTKTFFLVRSTLVRCRNWRRNRRRFDAEYKAEIDVETGAEFAPKWPPKSTPNSTSDLALNSASNSFEFGDSAANVGSIRQIGAVFGIDSISNSTSNSVPNLTPHLASNLVPNFFRS